MTVSFGLGYEMTSLEKDRKLLRQDDPVPCIAKVHHFCSRMPGFSPLSPQLQV